LLAVPSLALPRRLADDPIGAAAKGTLAAIKLQRRREGRQLVEASLSIGGPILKDRRSVHELVVVAFGLEVEDYLYGIAKILERTVECK
jgi:hypothetical protein